MKELKGIADIIASVNASSAISKIAGLDSPMMKIISAQNEWQKKLMPFRDHEIFNAVNRIHNMIPKFEHTGIMAAMNSVKAAHQLIPSDAVTAIMAIQKQNYELFSGARNILNALPSYPLFSQINSLQQAIDAISHNVATIAAADEDWELINEFEDIGNQAIELTENLSTDVQLTEEEHAAFESLIKYVVSFIKKHRKVGIFSLLFIDMVLRVASFHQYFDFLKAKPELATKEDFGKFERKLLESIREKLKEEREYRLTNRPCKILLKPKAKSTVIFKLPKAYEVIVLQINHKWAYISFSDPTDGVSQTGWVIKKYLQKPDQ